MSGKSDVHETEWNQPLEGVMLAEPAVAIAALGDFARLVETKAPNGAREFVLFSKSIAEHVAEASKEGGFWGLAETGFVLLKSRRSMKFLVS